jgi:glutathione S-transferase
MSIAAPDLGYVVYGNELSYFSRKLTAALTFYRVPFEMRQKTPAVADEVQMRSGSHQVPVLHTPENWLIADTTPLLTLLDGRHPMRRLFPDGALGVLVQSGPPRAADRVSAGGCLGRT